MTDVFNRIRGGRVEGDYFMTTFDEIGSSSGGSAKMKGRERDRLALEFRGSFNGLETAYLSKSLSRLFDSVNLAFSDDSPPSDGEIDNIGQVVSSEMQVTSFDPHLFYQVCRNVAKTVKLFGVKSEQLLSTDGEASQVIGNPSAGQKRNVAVVNALHHLRQGTSRKLRDDTC